MISEVVSYLFLFDTLFEGDEWFESVMEAFSKMFVNHWSSAFVEKILNMLKELNSLSFSL